MRVKFLRQFPEYKGKVVSFYEENGVVFMRGETHDGELIRFRDKGVQKRMKPMAVTKDQMDSLLKEPCPTFSALVLLGCPERYL